MSEVPRKYDVVEMEGYELRVNHARMAVLPGCGLYDEKFQRLARLALEQGELPPYWTWKNGILMPDAIYKDHNSFYKSAYRHVEFGLYRIAARLGLF